LTCNGFSGRFNIGTSRLVIASDQREPVCACLCGARRQVRTPAYRAAAQARRTGRRGNLIVLDAGNNGEIASIAMLLRNDAGGRPTNQYTKKEQLVGHHLFRLLSVIAVIYTMLGLVIDGLPDSTGVWAADVRPDEGHLAPDFTLKTLEGHTVRLSEFRGKKVVLINFWATWCPPCRLEMPTMQQIYSEYKERGFEILAVNIESDAKHLISDFVKELHLTFAILLDPDMKVTRKFRVIGLPVSVLIDRQGIVRAKEIGYHDWTSKASRKLVETLLNPYQPESPRAR
jgi:peroxiredoxin